MQSGRDFVSGRAEPLVPMAAAAWHNYLMENLQLNVALKEWDTVCEALCAGTQMILLRKGGILESGGEFEIEHDRFLLFPTFIHQNVQGLKLPYRSLALPVAAEPQTIAFPGWGEIIRIYHLPGRAMMDSLSDMHIWDTPLIDMRFNYRPDYPLYILLVRAYRFLSPPTLENTLDYAGCKSWVPLARALGTAESVRATTPEQLSAAAARIETAFRV